MQLSYLESRSYPPVFAEAEAQDGAPVGFVVHSFRDEDTGRVLHHIEGVEAEPYWCEKTEHYIAVLVYTPDEAPWRLALASVPPSARLASHHASQQQGGEVPA